MALLQRTARSEDIVACGEICYRAFRSISERHNFPPDFPNADVATGLISMLFTRPDIYSVVAELDGYLVGSNALWEGGPIAGVGPLTVDPRVQDVSIGRELMERVLDRARARRFAGVRLVQSAYHGRSLALYTKLGFDAREPLSVLQGPALRQRIAGYDVRPLAEDDIDDCKRLCTAVHGHERERDLRDGLAQGTATVVERDGLITGYASAIGFFGHAVAESNADLVALIAAAHVLSGPGLLVPTRNGALLRWCLARGLRIVQPATLMSLGLYNEPAGAFLPSIVY